MNLGSFARRSIRICKYRTGLILAGSGFNLFLYSPKKHHLTNCLNSRTAKSPKLDAFIVDFIKY
jgi:hypothetical protein